MDIEKVTIEDGQSADLVNENLEQLKNIFPEAFTEDGVDFATLRQLLGDTKVLDEGTERYSFNWHGKKAARQLALTPSTGTLLPCPEESVDWDNTQNMFIEGDNLEVLKLLQKSYANKVKMIYIDPPYNTGKDFVYKDSFGDNIKNYLELTRQTDEEGAKISSNTESGGRYHTNWLNMMYPRLKLARNLLKEDGVIFISIDDGELINIKKICDEIFGEENFITNITREAIKGGSQSKHIRVTHDYVLVYSKSISKLFFSGYEQEGIHLNLEDDKGSYAKGRELNKWGAGSRREDAPGMWFPVQGPNGEDVYPIRNDGSEGRWRLGKKNMHKKVADGDVIFEKRDDGTFIVYEKIRSGEPRIKQFTTLFTDNYINAKGTERIKSIFGIERTYFDYAKPCELIYDLMVMADIKEGEIVLDFFAGSSTTADSTFQYCASRKPVNFILVQLPELTTKESEAYKNGFRNICEGSKERIQKAATRIKEDNSNYNGDLGFKVFKLSTSNIRAWNPTGNIEDDLFKHKEHLIEGRSEDDILYELLVKRGVELTTPIQERIFADKKVYCIGYGVSFACLAESIEMEDIDELSNGIIAWHEECSLDDGVLVHVFFRDSAFADNRVKTNMAETLKQRGINHVKSL